MFKEGAVEDLKAKKHPDILEQTSSYYWGAITDVEFRSVVSQLAACEVLFRPERACVLFGYGSKSRRAYASLRACAGISVLWEGPLMPLWAYPLSYLVAAQGGLVVASNGTAMEQAMLTLSRLAMVELYCFSSSLLPQVLGHVRLRRWKSEVGSVIGTDSSYYCFGLDGDWATYPAWFSYGPQCPAQLKTLIPVEQETSRCENTGSPL
jgi:hypothetical protein